MIFCLKQILLCSILPSTKDTKHLLTDRHFDVMKESAVFINIGRGDVVEESILLEAMQTKTKLLMLF